MLLKDFTSGLQIDRTFIHEAYRGDEIERVNILLQAASLDPIQRKAIQEDALTLVKQVRQAKRRNVGIDSFLMEYSLSSEEGIALMCLAEALLRVPDQVTVSNLIQDKISLKNWESHLGQSPSFFINATTWSLMLTGKVLMPELAAHRLSKVLFKFIYQRGEGVIRKTVDSAIRILSRQFIMGRTIQEALTRAKRKEKEGIWYSYDMLGEAALTEDDAACYFLSYQKAIQAIGAIVNKDLPVSRQPGVSIKLSALHPRYEEAKRDRVLKELTPRLLQLAQLAKDYNIPFTIDAEESDRLSLSLDLIEKVFKDSSLRGWEGFGMAVQAYQKTAYSVLDWVGELAKSQSRRMMIRLVKGAYWDSEIKKAQVLGLTGYPVFTRKAFTDVSFQACAKKMFNSVDLIYPQFATHNAYSVAMILNLAGDYRDFEFQCLHGMGKELYRQLRSRSHSIPCRIYAPVGSYEALLPYLVRRLLENGANSSFIHRIVDEKVPIDRLVEDPIQKAQILLKTVNERIPLPAFIFSPERKNSQGVDLSDRISISELMHHYHSVNASQWLGKPLLAEREDNQIQSEVRQVSSPQRFDHSIGWVVDTSLNEVEHALAKAKEAFLSWGQTSVAMRIDCVLRFAELLETNKIQLMTMLCLEAGKTWGDAIAEVREAIDFCYYYTKMADKLLKPVLLTGYTGESNQLSLHPRGIIVCISPWNFPLAIFTGQIIAALMVGNCVIAKPAEQTAIIANFTVQLMHQAGIPVAAIQLVPGRGEIVGAALVADLRTKGIIFTGSTETAATINQVLAKRGGEIIPLIAETGGQNAMIVDSSALLEQAVIDVITSAFGSAGQRCSALRVLYVQEEVYTQTLTLLKGAMDQLAIGDPAFLSTDIGPVIDDEALTTLKNHVEEMAKKHNIVYQCTLSKDCEKGNFMPPTVIEIKHITDLKKEVFGPVLHIISYASKELNQVIEQINSTGYGLTLGIHSRINHRIELIRTQAHVGNCYVNRNMIGAVVGLQPFGGEGLSGTGPKAGGPYYLLRLCHERTYTVNTAAIGGNAVLMSLIEE